MSDTCLSLDMTLITFASSANVTVGISKEFHRPICQAAVASLNPATIELDVGRNESIFYSYAGLPKIATRARF